MCILKKGHFRPLSKKLRTLAIGLCMWTELFLAQIIQQKAVRYLLKWCETEISVRILKKSHVWPLSMKLQTLPIGLLHVNRAFPSSNHSTESSALAFKMMWNRNFSVYSQEKSCLTFIYEASDTANWPLHVNRAFPSSNHQQKAVR